MQEWSGGEVAQGLVDAYPQPPQDPVVRLTTTDVQRLLGISLTAEEIAGLLAKLEFTCKAEDGTVIAQTPPHRLDIGTGDSGVADLVEEVARMYGYDNIPATRLEDVLPEQRGNPKLEMEEQIRNTLIGLGLQEVINYRRTSPEREARLVPAGQTENAEYIRLRNPMTPDRAVLRRSLLASVLDTLEHNIRLRERLALFEIGPVFLPRQGEPLPDEPRRLSIAMTGQRQIAAWDTPSKAVLDFYDLKGLFETLLEMLHIRGAVYEPFTNVDTFHPGKCARVLVNEKVLGIFGELHPLVKENFDFTSAPVLAADLDLNALIEAIPWRYETGAVPIHPPVLEDIAVIVDEDVPASRVEELIRQGGGKMLAAVRLFDVFRSESIGLGKKSLAYNLTYQAPERTLTDTDAAQIRQRILRRLEQEIGAKLRS